MARKALGGDQLLRLDNQICFAVYSAARTPSTVSTSRCSTGSA